jgi:hypothetical protein
VMHNQGRQQGYSAMLSKFLTLLIVLSACSHNGPSKELLIKREVSAYYKIGKRKKDYPRWAAEYYDLEVANKLKEAGFHFKGKNSDGSIVFILDSGTRLTKEVACTMVRANGREKIAGFFSQYLASKFKGKPYDIYFLAEGLSEVSNILELELKNDTIRDEYFEERIIEGSARMKEQRGFHCALLVEISKVTLDKLKKSLILGLKSQYYYLPNLDQDLEALKF